MRMFDDNPQTVSALEEAADLRDQQADSEEMEPHAEASVEIQEPMVTETVILRYITLSRR